MSNYIGSFGITIIQLLSVPIYLECLGKSAYGMVGFYTTLQAVFTVFDLGLSATFNRELARSTVNLEDKNYSKDLLKTFELIYWIIAILIGIFIVFFASLIAQNWINDTTLSSESKTTSIALMGILFIFRWPIALYSGGLIGLQRQVMYNTINFVVELVKALGAIFILKYISNNMTSFFMWQVIVTFLSVIVFAIVIRNFLPQTDRKAQFKISIVKDLSRFAIGMSGIAVVSILLSQIDKIVLIKFVPISIFGFYTIASLIASSLSRVSAPLGQTFYPRLVQLVEQKNEVTLVKTFHQACQLMSVCIVPVSIVICFFSKQILFLWTHNEEVSNNSSAVLSILIIGYMFNSLASVPYLLQLAFGWTKLTFYQNIFITIILIPFLIFITPKYGILGVALFWMFVNMLILFVGANIMFEKIIKPERWNWLLNDVIKPILITLPIVGLFRFIFSQFIFPNQLMVAIFIVVTTLSSLVAATLNFGYTRTFFVKKIHTIIYAES